VEHGCAPSLHWQMARDDLSSIHRQRHDLSGEVPSEEGARRIPGRAPEHPVDHPKSDERRTRTARDRDTRVGQRETGECEDRCGEEKK